MGGRLPTCLACRPVSLIAVIAKIKPYVLQRCAKQALDLGASEDIAEIAQRFAVDPEIFVLAMRSLSALAAVPKGISKLVGGSTCSAAVVAFREHFRSIEFSSASSEDAGRLLSALSLHQQLARADVGAYLAAGGLDLLVEIASMAQARGSKALPAAAFGVCAPLITAAAQALDRLSRTKAGLDAMISTPTMLTGIVQQAAMNLNAAEIRSPDLRKSFRRAVSMAKLASRLSTPGKSSSNMSPTTPTTPRAGGGGLASPSASANVAGRDNNGHLEPLFRVLDRCVRTDTGKNALLGVNATTILPGILEQVQSGRAGASAGKGLEAIIMRVLAKLMGSDISALVGRVAGDESSVSVSERTLCCRLLAGLASDPDKCEQLLSDDGALVHRLVQQLTAQPLCISDAVVPLLQALTTVCRSSGEAVVALYDCDLLRTVGEVLVSRLDEPAVAAEAASCLTAMIDCADMVSTQASLCLDSGNSRFLTPGEHSLPALVMRSLEQANGQDATVLACMQYCEACLLHDDEQGAGVDAMSGGSDASASKLSARILKAMSSLPDSLPVQALGTDLCNYLARSTAALEAMVTHGVIPRIIANLTDGDSKFTPGATASSASGAFSPARPGQRSLFSPGAQAAEDEDDAAAAAAVIGGDSKATAALSLALVSSCLHLVTSLCAIPNARGAAKDAGVIHAVLQGYGPHSSDPALYKLFREVISAIDIDEGEVRQALDAVDVATSAFQSLAAQHDADVLRPVAEYCRTMGLPLRGAPPNSSQASMAEAMLENISLLEAVTASPVFVCIVAACGGIPALVRAVAVLSLAHTSDGPRASAGKGRDLASAAVVDQILSRACNTLAHVARVCFELGSDGTGKVEHDAAFEAMDYTTFKIAAELYDRESLAVLCKGMLNAAIPAYKLFAKDAITLLSWLASGKSHGDVRVHVDALISAQGVEACVAFLRAQQSALDICASVAGTLARISVSPKGAAAVAQRGASRQIIRMLRSTAALHSSQGDALLLSFLRLLDTCARGGSEAADLLRKQGTVDALVECLDAGTALDFFATDEESAVQARASMTLAGTAVTSGDRELAADITSAVTSLLSKLVGPDLVRDTVATLVQFGQAVVDQAGQSYTTRKAVRIQDYERTRIMRPVVLLGMLSVTADAALVGVEVLDNGASACVQLANAGLIISKAHGQEGTMPNSLSVEEELVACIPAALRTVRQVIGPLAGKGAQAVKAKRTMIAAIPVAVRAVDEKPEALSPALQCLAALCVDEFAAASVPSACEGRGIGVLMDALRASADSGEYDKSRDALLTLAGVAAQGESRPLVLVAGAPSFAASLLSDMVTDGTPDAVAACMTLLAHCAVESKVSHELLSANVLDSMKTALQTYCSDSQAVSADVLQAAAFLLAKLCVTKEVVSNVSANSAAPAWGRGEDARALLKRIVKILAGSSASLDSPRCSEAVLLCIAAACTAGGVVTAGAAEAAQSAVNEADGEQCCVLAMSSSAADDDVLAAGARALVAMGASSKSAKTLADIDEYAGNIPEWVEAGWEVDDPQVIDLVAGMADCMRALGSNIVSTASASKMLALPDLGDSYKEVLMTIWRAMHAVCMDQMSVAQPGDPSGKRGALSGKGLYAARADVLALGAQITGRLTQVGSAALLSEGPEGPHAVSGEDAVNVLATVLYAAREVVELRLVEAACRALDICLGQYSATCVAQCSSTGIIASMTILHEKLEDAVSSARAEEAAGTLGESSNGLAHTPLPELSRMLELVEASLSGMASKASSYLASSSSAGPLMDPHVAVDVLDAAAHVGTEDAGDDDAVTEDSGSVLQGTVTAYVKCSVAGSASAKDLPFSILSALAGRIQDEASGEGKLAPHGLAPLVSVRSIHSAARMLGSVGYTLRGSLGKGTGSTATVLRISALLDAAAALSLVGSPNWSKWKKVAVTVLAGDKPEKADLELDAAPKGISGAGDAATAKQHWLRTMSIASSALQAVIDLLAQLSSGSDVPGLTQDVGKATTLLPLALALQGAAPSSPAIALSAVRALARLSDAAAPAATGATLASRVERIAKLGTAGAYRALLTGISAAANDDGEEYPQEAVSLVAALLRVQGVDVGTLGLTKSAILALQGAVRKHGGNKVLAAAGGALLTALQSVFTEQSGTAFEAEGKRAVAAMSELVKSSYARHMTEDGQLYYARTDSDESSWEQPDIIDKAMQELLAVDRMTRQLEDEAVTVVSPAVVEGMMASLTAHAHDPGVVGILSAALAKLAANPDNHAALINQGVVASLAKIIEEEGHVQDPRCAEAFVSLVLPLSFDQDAVRTALGPANVAGIVLSIAERFGSHLTSHVGSPMSWVPESCGDYNGQLARLEQEVAKSGDKDERTKKTPRLAQSAAQTVANLACDNAPSAGSGRSTVDELIDHGAVDKLAALMRTHPDNPRLLEDAICGLSNLAFVSDDIQLRIGRTCMDAVCATATRFNGDAYVFEMTLRAIGNLTRVDENILRAVGYGVIRGMVEGMRKHTDSPSTLKLCADVMGNMVSIDPRRQDRSEAVAVLQETLADAEKLGIGDRSQTSAVGYSEKEIVARLQRGEVDVKEAVCSLLYKDGGAKALVDTMTSHPGKSELAASCLRALNYCVSCPSLAAELVPALDLASRVVLVCNANDTSTDVIKRTCRILGGMAGNEKLASAVAAARAASALLTVLDAHRANRELCFLSSSVLTMLKGPGLCTAVKEMRGSLEHVANLFKSGVSEGDVELYAVQLELLQALAADADLAVSIANKAGPSLVQLLSLLSSAKAPLGNDQDALTLLSFTFSTLSSITRHGTECASALLECGLTLVLCGVMDMVLTAGAHQPAILLAKEARRAALSSVQIISDAVRPPARDGHVSSPQLSTAQTVLAEGAGPVLERLLQAYKAIPDPANPGTLLYDAATTKAAVTVLADLTQLGHTLSPGVTLDIDFLQTGIKPDAVASSSSAPRNGPRSAGKYEADAAVMIDKGIAGLDVWIEGKARKARVLLTADREALVVIFKDGKDGKAEEAEVQVGSIKKVILGNPSSLKKKFFGKSAKAERSVTIEAEAGLLLGHFELESDKDRMTLSHVLAALAGVQVE